jgi:hypothetical protein
VPVLPSPALRALAAVGHRAAATLWLLAAMAALVPAPGRALPMSVPARHGGGASGQTVEAVIGAGSSSTPLNTAAGAVQFDPLGIGQTVVSVAGPTHTVSGAQARRTIVVAAPTLTLGNGAGGGSITVRSGQRSGCATVALQVGAPAGAVLTLTSSNGAAFQVATGCGTSAGTLGTSASTTLPTATTTALFQVQAGTLTGTATLTVSVPGYANATMAVSVTP